MSDIYRLLFGLSNVDRRLRLLLLVLFIALVDVPLTRVPWTIVKRYPAALGGRTFETHEWEWIWAGAPRVWADARTELTVQRHWLGWISTIVPAFIVYFSIHVFVLAEVRAARWNRGVCEQCAYGLHTEGSATCPECGHRRVGRLPRDTL